MTKAVAFFWLKDFEKGKTQAEAEAEAEGGIPNPTDSRRTGVIRSQPGDPEGGDQYGAIRHNLNNLE